jgi:hypothetical protein
VIQRSLWLSLILLAPPLAGQLPDPSILRTGALSLHLSEAPLSTLGLDPGGLEITLCGPPPASKRLRPPRKGGGVQECKLVIANGGGTGGRYGEPFALAVRTVAVDHGCDLGHLAVAVSALHFVALQPWSTSCGNWDASLDLAEVAQPSSELTLLPAASGAPTGLATGTLKAYAVATFQHTTSGRTVQFAVPLQLDVAARWTAVQSTAALAAGDSNLALFVDREGGAWTGRPATAGDRQRCTRLSLEALGGTTAALNTPVP